VLAASVTVSILDASETELLRESPGGVQPPPTSAGKYQLSLDVTCEAPK